MTTDRVNASFQKNMLDFISPKLNEEEQELARRGRNLSIPVGRRSIQADYRQATAFEVLIGYWYLHHKERLSEIYDFIKTSEFFN
jgi:23S rRNA maturation mini-RNase III